MPEPQRARNLDRAERKFDVMQALGTDLLLVCSNVQPAAIDDDRARRRRSRRDGGARRTAAACASATRRWPGAATSTDGATPGRSCRGRDHPALGLIVDSFHTLALGDDPAGIADRAGRQALLRAARRRAAAVDGRAVLEPAFPQLPRPGRLAGRAASCARCWRPAIAARCRSRSSTTSSAPRPRG